MADTTPPTPEAPDDDPLNRGGIGCPWTVGRRLGLWGTEGPPPGTPGNQPPAYDYGPVFQRVRRRLPKLVQQVHQRRQEAVAHLAELRGLPPEERRRALKDPRFRNPALVELLLETSGAVQRREPGESEELAGLAAALAARTEPTPDDLAAIFARSLGLAANARRLRGEHRAAEVALEQAVPFLAQAADWGAFCRGLGLLRWEQGRLHPAAALFDHAAALFQKEKLAPEQGDCLALLGLLLTEAAAYASALPILGAALAVLETRRRPWLAVRARLALALTLAETGQAKVARQTRAEAWRDYRWLDREDDLLPLQWLGGQIAARLREREAGALLDAVGQESQRQGRLAETALMALDWSRTLPKPRRAGELAVRTAEMAEAFAGRKGLERVLGRLRESAGGTESRTAAAAGLRRALRAGGIGPAPLPFV
ncbi:MAG TPA: hypothetical protein VFE33_34315 [Thermoanaerobaculia bacterium]|nr:hypothetical protein [Thermoanaerobaculia bacterium]